MESLDVCFKLPNKIKRIKKRSSLCDNQPRMYNNYKFRLLTIIHNDRYCYWK